MGMKQDVIIKNKFGSKTPRKYILRYTSRKDATESLDAEAYITKYTTRYSAVEQLKYEAPSTTEIMSQDESLSRKDGVLFGNRGLSYSDEMLHEAAAKTQNAADQGHVVMIPLLSFSHEYLKKHHIIPEDMEEPTQAGAYKGQVDQLKLRQSVSDMMDGMHRDMGFTHPEWTGTIQLDTKHVHVHLTTVETGKSKSKRMKRVKDVQKDTIPKMDWHVDDKISPYEETFDHRGLIQYEREGEVVASQALSKKGVPKFEDVPRPTDRTVLVEKGKINDRTKNRMRYQLDRSLNKKRDIRPFVKNIYDKRYLTKSMTKNAAFHNDVTAEKLQVLQASLPDNKRMWRAKSNAKAMERSHEIANEIVDELWTRHDKAIRLEDFDNVVIDYIDARQTDESFDDNQRQFLYENAYDRLRQETINGLYKSMKELDDKDKTVEIPKYSIQATSTNALQNEIADMHKREPKTFDKIVLLEYRNRDYNERLKNAMYQSSYYQNEVNNYDDLNAKGYTSSESSVVRDYYMEEYKYYSNISDKYAYITMGKESGVSAQRFEEVKGSDLINMLYDYGPNEDRSIPQVVAEQYKQQTNDRYKAMRETMSYLVRTGQYQQYEMMRDKQKAIKNESLIAHQIESELKIPTPKRNDRSTIETRQTIDTYQGRKLLKSELHQIEKTTKDLRQSYENDTNFEKVPQHRHKKKEKLEPSVRWSDTHNKEDIQRNHKSEFRVWSLRRIQFEQQQRDLERRQKEEKIQKELEKIRLDEQLQNERVAQYEQEVNAMDNDMDFDEMFPYDSENEQEFEKN